MMVSSGEPYGFGLCLAGAGTVLVCAEAIGARSISVIGAASRAARVCGKANYSPKDQLAAGSGERFVIRGVYDRSGTRDASGRYGQGESF